MNKFALLLHPGHVEFVSENYLPFMQDGAFNHELDATCEYFTYNLDPAHYQNPMVQALATTFLFCRLNARLQGEPTDRVPDGLLDTLTLFARWGKS